MTRAHVLKRLRLLAAALLALAVGRLAGLASDPRLAATPSAVTVALGR